MYKKDHSGVSAANNFYTHEAKVVKQKSGYNVTLTVKVKHGLVKFEPVSMSAGRIFDRTFTHQNGKDIWTYTFHIDSIKVLEHEIAGKVRLSVPIANIHQRTFEVWFSFGKLDLRKGSITQKQSAISNETESKTSTTTDSASPTSSKKSAAATQAPLAEKAATKPEKVESQATLPGKKALAKYDVLPKDKQPTYADVALIKYPILEEVIIFIVLTGAIVGVTLFLSKKVKKKEEK